jgi:FkbM family methyltransferase
VNSRARARVRDLETRMRNPPRKIAFVLASTEHGTMIVNRFDHCMYDAFNGIGVGLKILENGAFEPEEVELALWLLSLRRRHFGDGVVALDCGANIGVHTVEWAKHMNGWGQVIAIEAQERVFYALAGNIVINNCLNARAMHAAVAAQTGTMRIPTPDYLSPASFGSLELRPSERNEFIGQEIDYSDAGTVEIRTITIDSLDLARLDFLKIDVEGMEIEALGGAAASLSRCRPVVIVESLKSDASRLRETLERHGYRVFAAGINLLAIHGEDKTLADLERTDALPMPVVKLA